jgi:enoyl-CoA hydratase/carnithine racemase
MTYQTILLDIADNGVATVTLNRPDRLNAFDAAMITDFGQLWADIGSDDRVRAIVLRAAGERAFCTGYDIKQATPLNDPARPFDAMEPGTKLGPKQNRVWKPLICAIHGMFAGGAFYWLNESEIAICSEEAQFFDPHVTFGQVAAVEPIGLLGRLAYGEIARLVLMGNDERVVATTALRIGLVSEVTTREALWARADEIAQLIAAKPAAAVQGSVKALWEARDMPPSVAIQNAMAYPQLGNPIGKAQIDRNAMPKAVWRPR